MTETAVQEIETANRADKAALQLSMKIAMRDPDTKRQLEAKLKNVTWFDVACFAAYNCQMDALHLKPWDWPPCWADENANHPANNDAQKLLRRMLKAGVSRWHPDPMAALGRKLGNNVRFRG